MMPRQLDSSTVASAPTPKQHNARTTGNDQGDVATLDALMDDLERLLSDAEVESDDDDAPSAIPTVYAAQPAPRAFPGLLKTPTSGAVASRPQRLPATAQKPPGATPTTGPALGDLLALHPPSALRASYLEKLALSRSSGLTKWKRRYVVLAGPTLYVFRSGAHTERAISELPLSHAAEAFVETLPATAPNPARSNVAVDRGSPDSPASPPGEVGIARITPDSPSGSPSGAPSPESTPSSKPAARDSWFVLGVHIGPDLPALGKPPAGTTSTPPDSPTNRDAVSAATSTAKVATSSASAPLRIWKMRSRSEAEISAWLLSVQDMIENGVAAGPQAQMPLRPPAAITQVPAPAAPSALYFHQTAASSVPVVAAPMSGLGIGGLADAPTRRRVVVGANHAALASAAAASRSRFPSSPATSNFPVSPRLPGLVRSGSLSLSRPSLDLSPPPAPAAHAVLFSAFSDAVASPLYRSPSDPPRAALPPLQPPAGYSGGSPPTGGFVRGTGARPVPDAAATVAATDPGIFATVSTSTTARAPLSPRMDSPPATPRMHMDGLLLGGSGSGGAFRLGSSPPQQRKSQTASAW
ncbi:hypothetical protein HK405_014110 [Cladochytrium tenue]|nr:hypothetical protein HK405_014110 [Cladochytrium tenue]